MRQAERQRSLAAAMALFGVASVSILPAPAKHPGKPSPLAPQEQVANGRKLFSTLECSKCHSLAGQGGCLAPPLDDVTQRRSDEYLMLRLGEGEEDAFIDKIGHPELLPHPRFNKRHLRDIIAYLHALKPAGTDSKRAASKKTTNVGAKRPTGGRSQGTP